MSEFLKVARLADVPPGTCRCVVVKGRRIALVNLDGEICAVDDTCPHAEASLSEGDVVRGEIVCPLHGASFDVRSGEVTGPPATEDLMTYEVRISGGDIEVAV